MTIPEAIKMLRTSIGDRHEHHPNCESNFQQDLSKCDCYAKSRENEHRALDLLEEVAKRSNPAK